MKNDFFRIHALFTRTTNQSPCLHEILATGGVYGLDKSRMRLCNIQQFLKMLIQHIQDGMCKSP